MLDTSEYFTAWAHPRACGENFPIGDNAAVAPGSSPRVRGKLLVFLHAIRHRRLIPARAGKTGPPSPPTRPAKAHPRACGENSKAAAIGSRLNGSSPRVRGKPGAGGPLGGFGRLIPARAGKTPPRRRQPRPPRAHPRACGENDLPKGGIDLGLGSSPRVRGKLFRECTGASHHGLIPARAGKTHEVGA